MLIVLVMLIGLVFSAINFVAPHQTFALNEANGKDMPDENGDAADCELGGDQCMIVIAKPR